MGNGEENRSDDTYTVSISDEKLGDVSIKYEAGIDDYLLHADFKRGGDTVLTFVSLSGEKTEYGLHIEKNTYDVKKRAE